MKMKTKEAIKGYLFALPSLLGLTIFILLPFMLSLFYCFTEGISRVSFVGIKNFVSLLRSPTFLLAVKNTIIFNLISVPAIMIIAFLLALLLNSNIKGQSFFRTLFMIPLVVPVASVVLVWQIIFNRYGQLNYLLSFFGAQTIDWLNSQWSVIVLVIIYIWKNCGYNMILFLTALNNIPIEYYESAEIDGAGVWARLSRITLPLLVPPCFFISIISMINSLKVFREAYLLAGSYPHKDIYMLQHFMNNNFLSLSYQRLSTAAFLMGTIVFSLVLLLYKIEARFRKGME